MDKATRDEYARRGLDFIENGRRWRHIQGKWIRTDVIPSPGYLPSPEVLDADHDQMRGIWADHMERCGCTANHDCPVRGAIVRVIVAVTQCRERYGRE
jgi:hypothetical protein